jgi:hypothetical protein
MPAMNDERHNLFPWPILLPDDFEDLLDSAGLPTRPPWLSLQQLASYWLTIQSETTTRQQIRPLAKTVRKISQDLQDILTAPSNHGHAVYVGGLLAHDALLVHEPVKLLKSISDVSIQLELAQKSKGRSTIAWVENPLALLLLEYYELGGKTGLPSNEDGPNVIAKNRQVAFAKRFIQIVYMRANALDTASRGPFWTTELIEYLRAASADTTLVRLLRRARKRSRRLSRTWLYPNGRSYEEGRPHYL